MHSDSSSNNPEEILGILDTLRQDRRFTFEEEVSVSAQRAGIIPGRALNLSQSGIAVLAPVELLVGETAVLEFKSPMGALRIKAVVRDRDVFRYGFKFVELSTVDQEGIKNIIELLAVLEP